jgi:hypothetical protein
MTQALAAFEFILATVPCVYFDVDLGDDLSWRIMLSTQTEHDTSNDEDHLEDIRAFAKKGTPAFRMDMFDDDKGWSAKNPAKDEDGKVIKGREPTPTETIARYNNEPATRKRNPVIAAFVKAHKRLPMAQDTFNLKAAGDILIPTTYRPQGEAKYTGKYSAQMNDTLTQEQWDAIPEHQKNRQNCVYELMHTSDISIDATAIETPVMEDTPRPVAARRRW